MFQFVFPVLFWSFVLMSRVLLSISSFFLWFYTQFLFWPVTCQSISPFPVYSLWAPWCLCQFSSPEPVHLKQAPRGMFLVDVSGFILNVFCFFFLICTLPFLVCVSTPCFVVWTFELIWFLVSGCELKACFCVSYPASWVLCFWVKPDKSSLHLSCGQTFFFTVSRTHNN